MAGGRRGLIGTIVATPTDPARPPSDAGACASCGAPSRDGRACRAQWEELLALEFSDPRAGAVHLLTVASYQLQHAGAFGLGASGVDGLQGVLEDVVDRGRPVADVRAEMQRRLDGATRVRADAADDLTVRWTATVADVWPPDPEDHATRVRRWTAAVLADLRR